MLRDSLMSAMSLVVPWSRHLGCELAAQPVIMASLDDQRLPVVQSLTTIEHRQDYFQPASRRLWGGGQGQVPPESPSGRVEAPISSTSEPPAANEKCFMRPTARPIGPASLRLTT